ncbi:MAG: adenosylcobinamide-GDP ribazoletransferase [Caldilineaceae bacterium]
MGSELALAFSFLTVTPMPTIAYQPGLLARAGRWFPLVGLMMGALLAAAQWGLGHLFTPLLSATLVIALWAALTGGLHLDGVADCCDGLLAPVPAERRLEIMRDPRTGAFAVIGLVLLLLLKVGALATLTGASPLLLATTWSRWNLLWTARQPLARPSGLGADFGQHLALQTVLQALLLPLALALYFFHWRTVVAIVLAVGATLLLNHFAQRRLGGVTGDVYGLTVEVSEVVILLIFSAAR